jgi:hypothetical protein
MDPEACYREFLDAMRDREWGQAALHAENLADWLRSGGFPPERLRERLRTGEQPRVFAHYFSRTADVLDMVDADLNERD